MTVFLHIGAPKTGTTALQQMLREQRRRLAADGVCYPGRRGSSHFNAARDVLGESLGLAAPAPGSWQRLARETHRWKGRASLVSHEILAKASAEQVERVVRSLEGQRVEVVYTARNLFQVIPSTWQESLKNRQAHTYATFLQRLRAGHEGGPEAQWRTNPWVDLTGTLQRWSSYVAPERVHVVVLPRRPARDHVWGHIAELVGVDAARYQVPKGVNESLGPVEAEVLCRLNGSPELKDLDWPAYYERVRQSLLERLGELSEDDDRRLGVPVAHVPWVTHWAEEQADWLRSSGVTVHGDPAELAVPDRVMDESEAVDEEAVTALCVEAVASLLTAPMPRPGRLRQARSRVVGAVRERLNAARYA